MSKLDDAIDRGFDPGDARINEPPPSEPLPPGWTVPRVNWRGVAKDMPLCTNAFCEADGIILVKDEPWCLEHGRLVSDGGRL